MLRQDQIDAINRLSEEQARKTFMSIGASNHPDKFEVMDYLTERIKRLNRDTAMVEQTDMSDMGID